MKGDTMLRARRDILITKLEAINYNLTGLVKYRLVSGKDAVKLSNMSRTIERMLKPYEGVSVHDESDNVGC